jgi:triosephosphate isomerase
MIAGNWKMHKTLTEAVSLAGGIREGVSEIEKTQVVLCPPFTALAAVAQVVGRSNVALGAQNVYWETEGAYTGEISPKFLVDVGCEWVIVGHSERRKYFGETDQSVNRRITAALNSQLDSIVCVGETLEQREQGITESVVETQVRGAFNGLGRQELGKLVVAYEPVWAIGTGKTASPDMANDVHIYIRKLIAELYDGESASAMRVLYGGSVTPDNITSLIAMSDIDGALVGGASLKAPSFVDIAKRADDHYRRPDSA